MAVNITTDTNTVKVTSTTTNNVKIVDNGNNTSVSVSQPTTRVIKVATVGPQGPAGPAGFPYTGSAQITGSLGITGSASIVNSTNNSTLDLHTHDQGPWLFQMFNDTYSTGSTVFEGGSFDTGEFLIGNSTNKPIQIYNNSNYESPTLIISSSGVTVNNNLTVTGNQVITGSLTVSGSLVMSPSSSFILPLSASTTPQKGSAYWSGSFLFVYNGTRYMSASFF